MMNIKAIMVALGVMLFASSATAHHTAKNCTALKTDIEALACVAYFEYRSGTNEDQFAVMQVVMNRVESKKYPNSIYRVAYQKAFVKKLKRYVGQFSYTTDGISDVMKNREQMWRARLNAIIFLTAREQGWEEYLTEVPRSSLWYARHDIKRKWMRKMKKVARVGDHVFYAM